MNVSILQQVMAKGKSSQKCKKALDDLNDLASFNQYVSYCVGKAIQHLADVMFIQMANFTLLRRLLVGLFKGVKPDLVSNEKCSSSSRIRFKGLGHQRGNRFQPYGNRAQ